MAFSCPRSTHTKVGRLFTARLATTAAVAALCMTLPAAPAVAQAAPPPNTLVSVCSGVSLPRSVVTGIIDPVVTGIYGPVEARVNGILGFLTNPLLPAPLSVNVNGLLTNAAAGNNIRLAVVASDGTLVGPSDACNASADSYSLDNPAGIAIGGNQITGLGAPGQQALAGEINSIALGNRAATAPTSARAIAIGYEAQVGPNATGSIALGGGTAVTVRDSVALGSGSIASRGPISGLSAGEVSVGAPGAERQITNVAAGTQGTDAVNLAQLNAAIAGLPAGAANAVVYDNATHTIVTLQGAGGTTVTNVAPGALSAGSTDAVNGSQLFATNQQVQANSAAIANLQLAIGGGGGAGVDPVAYSNPATPTTSNGGTPTNDVTLVGAAAAPVALHNVANGVVAAGSTDAVNGGQLYELAQDVGNAVAYDDATHTQVTLDPGGAPATIHNLAAGVAPTDAANVGQVTAAFNNAVSYDNASHTSVTLNGTGAAAVVHNVAAGVAATDAANVGQITAAMGNAVTIANSYTDTRIVTLGEQIAAMDFDVRRVRRDAAAGTAGALAAAALPQAMDPGRSAVAGGVGIYGGRVGFAVGGSFRASNGNSVYKIGVTYDAAQRIGANAGFAFQF